MGTSEGLGMTSKWGQGGGRGPLPLVLPGILFFCFLTFISFETESLQSLAGLELAL